MSWESIDPKKPNEIEGCGPEVGVCDSLGLEPQSLDELRTLPLIVKVTKHEITYDEKYLWE